MSENPSILDSPLSVWSSRWTSVAASWSSALNTEAHAVSIRARRSCATVRNCWTSCSGNATSALRDDEVGGEARQGVEVALLPVELAVRREPEVVAALG